MIAYYGSYALPNNAVLIASSYKVMKNKGGEMYARMLGYKVDGYLSGSGSAAIAQVRSALATALASPYQDFVFKHDDGTATDIALYNNQSLSGVTVNDLEFDGKPGPGYASEAHFTFSVEATYALNGTDNILLDFTEQIKYRGGGPRFTLREAVVGIAQKQQTREETIYYAMQSGSSEGYTRKPDYPPPLWPDDVLGDPEFGEVTPMKIGRGYMGYKIDWAYKFGRNTPFPTAAPHLWT